MNAHEWADAQFRKKIRKDCKNSNGCAYCQYFNGKECRVKQFIKKNQYEKQLKK